MKKYLVSPGCDIVTKRRGIVFGGHPESFITEDDLPDHKHMDQLLAGEKVIFGLLFVVAK